MIIYKGSYFLLVGTVRIPVDDVSSRYLNERWYPLTETEKLSPAAPAPALRIKCRYQSVDVMPIDHYARFLDYLKRNYRRLCEYLEPVIGTFCWSSILLCIPKI